MIDRQPGLSALLKGDLSIQWTRSYQKLVGFFQMVGLKGDEDSQVLYINPIKVSDLETYLSKIRLDKDEHWYYIGGHIGTDQVVLAFPVNKKLKSSQASSKGPLALFIEVHSRLISWWLVNAWRSQQLANATWHLSDSRQLIPAAACARSLLETAASFWLEATNVRELWNQTKLECATRPPDVNNWLRFRPLLNEIVWAGKFDKRAPELEQVYGRIKRQNVLTQIEKLARATDSQLQTDYQLLCNVVHPSVGGMLVFTTPILLHESHANIFQWVCGAGAYIQRSSGEVSRVTEIQEALARSTILAATVLERTLDEALKVVDDIGLTTKAPKMASFSYWRNLGKAHGRASCPCRSGLKSKHCLHRWTDPAPAISERFPMVL
jgi:hypothetical protein